MRGAFAALLSLGLALCGPAHAQAVVGSAVVDGRKVQLFDDFTWQFETLSETSCALLTKRLEFCGLDLWKVAAKTNPDALATYRADERHYAQFIFENIGSKDGLTPEGVRGALVQMVGSQTGTAVTIVENTPVTVDGVAAETLVYIIPYGGIDNVFANTFVLGDDYLLQVQTWQVGPLPYSDRHRTLHQSLVEATRIKPGN